MVRLFIISVNQVSLYEAVSDMCKPAHEEDLLRRYQERIEKLSQQDRVIKFCTDAGFLTAVVNGQYLVTKKKKKLKKSHN